MRRILLLMTAFWLLWTGPAGAQEDPDHHPLDAHLTEAYTEDLPGLIERKYIRVLTTMNRTNFFLA